MVYRLGHAVELTEVLKIQKISMMLFYADRRLLQSHLRPLRVLFSLLLLTHLCTGQSQLIGPSQPVIATLGDDIILPCHLEPIEDASDLTLEWTRPDLDPRFVLVWRTGEELEAKKHKSFKGRTSLFIDELNVGNISLKLSTVRLSDQGRYRCFIPTPDRQAFVQLIVASDVVSSPLITLAGIDKQTTGVILQCESKGWHPEPEVSWLDGEGHVLSAGPTETVRGPDGLYTVSSRVTVEKRHNNNFTCRVQQKNINQTRETQICVPDDFFQVQSSSSASTVGLAVCLAVCILVILLLLFFVWRQNRIKTTRSRSEIQFAAEDKRQGERLMTDETGQKSKRKEKKKSKNGKSKKQDVSQSSTTVPDIEVQVNQQKKVIDLINTSEKEQQLGGWKLNVQINDREPFTHTFEESFKLSPEQTLPMVDADLNSRHTRTGPAVQGLKLWGPGDKLQVVLFNNTGEIQHLSIHIQKS